MEFFFLRERERNLLSDRLRACTYKILYSKYILEFPHFHVEKEIKMRLNLIFLTVFLAALVAFVVAQDETTTTTTPASLMDVAEKRTKEFVNSELFCVIGLILLFEGSRK